jgi:hypothetical protein
MLPWLSVELEIKYFDILKVEEEELSMSAVSFRRVYILVKGHKTYHVTEKMIADNKFEDFVKAIKNRTGQC